MDSIILVLDQTGQKSKFNQTDYCPGLGLFQDIDPMGINSPFANEELFCDFLT